MAFRDGLMGESSKLEGNPNYSVWSIKMRHLLDRDDAWRLIDPPPGTVVPTAPVDIVALEASKKKALTIITLSVRHNVIPHIANITDPA